MSNEAQTITPADTVTARPDKLKSSQSDMIARFVGGENSPNLPVGQWAFILNAAGDDAEVFSAYPKDKQGNEDTSKTPYSYLMVTPKGNPEGQKRRVYTSALTAPTAKDILYNGGSLRESATFGVFTGEANGVRTTIVSSDVQKVLGGITAANAAYAVKRKKDEDDAKAANGAG